MHPGNFKTYLIRLSVNKLIPFSFSGHPGELVAPIIDNSTFTSKFLVSETTLQTNKPH